MIALQGGTVYTVTQGVIEGGTVLIEGSHIAAVGKQVILPDGCWVIDVTGKVIMPGMIDCHTHLGIAVEGVGDYGNDKNEVELAIGPHLRALDAINPEDRGLQDARAGGITAIIVTPGSENVIGGLSVAIKTYGTVIDDMVLRQPAGLKVSFGENPKHKCMQKQTGFPSTRMGIAALIREQFVKAQDYLRKWERSQRDPSQFFERDLALEAVTGVLKGEYPMRAHAHAAEDIMTAIRIAEEFNIGLTIEHATEGHKIAEKLAKCNIPCSVGPSLTARVKVELNNRDFKTPGLLHQAGVKVALITDHPILPIDCLRMEAIVAIREGLPKEVALRAITIDAAEIMGVSDRIGSLEPGKDADIVVLDSHLFDFYARVERVFINGQEVVTK
jgi:imidazolonepropionase-like amidohydrolase